MDNVALIISTYDKSEDLWLPLEQSYNKFWNDISIPIYLSTNFKKFKSESFNSLQIKDEVSWSDNLIKSLNKIDQKYVLLTFDDLFLTAKVDNKSIEDLMQIGIKNKYNYIQFYRSISSGKTIDKMLFKKNMETKYKNSTIWSFWKKSVLLNLLVKEETAWEFEIKGNVRSFSIQDFYSTKINMIPFVNGVVKGKWNPLAKSKLRKLGFEISNERASFGFVETIRYKFRDLQFNVLSYLIQLIN